MFRHSKFNIKRIIKPFLMENNKKKWKKARTRFQ